MAIENKLTNKQLTIKAKLRQIKKGYKNRLNSKLLLPKKAVGQRYCFASVLKSPRKEKNKLPQSCKFRSLTSWNGYCHTCVYVCLFVCVCVFVSQSISFYSEATLSVRSSLDPLWSTAFVLHPSNWLYCSLLTFLSDLPLAHTDQIYN